MSRRPFGAFAARHKILAARTETQKRRLAELMADGHSITAAGRAIGVSQQRASEIFKLIKADLGWQAQ